MKHISPLLEELYRVLEQYSPRHDYVVAYSGGMDSRVLLHSMAKLAREYGLTLKAIHVNHGLSPESDDWERHCMDTCRCLSIELLVRKITVPAESAHGPESAARQARYEAIADELAEGQVVLTAHHRRDQAETFLLQLMRGSGISGLSAMSVLRPFPPGWLLRPFLHTSQESLTDYARSENLVWIQDPSNQDLRYNRNYVRHEVLPVLQKRWPAAVNVIDRSSLHLAEVSELVDTLAEQDLNDAQDSDRFTLNLNAFTALPFIRRKNLLRFWIKNYCGSVPPTSELEQIARVLCEAGPDSNPLLEWNNLQIRRYRERIYILPTLPPVPGGLQLEWELDSTLQLPLGKLKALRAGNDIVPAAWSGNHVQIRFRQGGEKIRPVGHRHTRTVKNLLQEASTPSWIRDYIPLLFINDRLVLIPGICQSAEFPAELADRLEAVVWEIPDDILPGRLSAFRTELTSK